MLSKKIKNLQNHSMKKVMSHAEFHFLVDSKKTYKVEFYYLDPGHESGKKFAIQIYCFIFGGAITSQWVPVGKLEYTNSFPTLANANASLSTLVV